MKIQAGKQYKNRRGDTIEIVQHEGEYYRGHAEGMPTVYGYWAEDGTYSAPIGEQDLIEEVT